MPLPTKSRYTIAEAGQFIANATGETVTTSQVIDYGIQRFYGLYMLAYRGCQVRYEDDSQISEISGSLVQVHPNVTQAATLESGYSMKIDSGLHDGRKCDFVEPGTSPAWRMKQPASFNSTDLILLGAELAAFTASLAKPQQTAPATDTATPTPVVTGDAPAKQVNAIKKAALIAELEYEWSSIEADISDAKRVKSCCPHWKSWRMGQGQSPRMGCKQGQDKANCTRSPSGRCMAWNNHTPHN